MVGFVPTIVGSKHNTPKSMVHFKHEETGGSIYLLQIKATAKSDSWVAHLLVLSTDIIRRYCPKRKQQFSSIRFQGTKKTYLVVWNIRT